MRPNEKSIADGLGIFVGQWTPTFRSDRTILAGNRRPQT
jgi:hypothetical protein